MTAISVDLKDVQDKAPYLTQQFVGRNAELTLVNTEIRNLRTSSVQSRPILNFWAVQGSGKSWLLHHIARKHALRLTKTPKLLTLPLLYEFLPDPQEIGSLVSNLTRTLARAGLEQLPPDVIPTNLRKAAETGDPIPLVSALKELTNRFILILLLDGAEKVPAEKWQEIERHILEPVLVTGKALLIVSGRRQMPPWRNFELRRRVMDTDRTYLYPFGNKEVAEQVSKLKVELPLNIQAIRPYTANSPLLVRALVQTYRQQQRKPGEWLRPFRQQAIDQLLKDVNPEVIDVLRAVSTLRFYRLDAVNYMLSSQKSIENPDHYFFRLLQSLEPETDLAWWDNKHRAYVTSEIIRNLFNEQQKDEDLPAYLTEHQRAVRMYRGFADEFPAGSEEHLIEILYHLGCIYQVDKQLKTVRQDAQEVLAFARKNLDISRRLTLYTQLGRDDELSHVLPIQVLQYLQKELGNTSRS